MIKKILQQLLNIALKNEIDVNSPPLTLLYEAQALNAYYKIVYLLFKRQLFIKEAKFKPYILSPLDALNNSLFNDCALSKVL